MSCPYGGVVVLSGDRVLVLGFCVLGITIFFGYVFVFLGGITVFCVCFASRRFVVCLCVCGTAMTSGGSRYLDVTLWRRASMTRSRAKCYHYWLRSLS